MGYVAHDAIVVTTWRLADDWPDVEGFREQLSPEWQQLLVGPIQSVVNFDTTWFFAPDGSKSGWETDREGEEHRARFEALFDGKTGYDVLRLTYGSDHRYSGAEPQAEYVGGVE